MAMKDERALEAVKAGAVKHAHPFTWATEAEYLDVSPKTLERLARAGRIKVEANAPGYWRPVKMTEER